MRLELDRTRANLFVGAQPGPISPPIIRARHSPEMIGCEENLIHALSQKLKSLRAILSLTGEIFLLSSKNKY